LPALFFFGKSQKKKVFATRHFFEIQKKCLVALLAIFLKYKKNVS